MGCVIDPNRQERYSESSEVEAFQWVLKRVYACVFIVVFVWVSLCLSLRFDAAQISLSRLVCLFK